jgi:DNA-binding NarL/FixJ family response regulator
MIRLVIADDQDLVREGLRMMLDAEPDLEVVGEASTGVEALARTRALDPDVVLMDIRMPGLDGIAATSRLAAAGSRAKVLVLTTFDLDEYVYRAMRAGASGFLLKDATREQLTAGVRAVHLGDALLAPTITRRIVEDYCHRPSPDRSAAIAGTGLSDREVEVVELVAAGLSNAEIAERLVIGGTTVKSHVARILAKLGLRDRVQVVVFAYESGIVRPGDSVGSGEGCPTAGPRPLSSHPRNVSRLRVDSPRRLRHSQSLRMDEANPSSRIVLKLPSALLRTDPRTRSSSSAVTRASGRRASR